MKYIDNNRWTYESFLNYCEKHSKTPRALFHKNMIAEMCRIYGDKKLEKGWANSNIKWRSVDFSDWIVEIRARVNI
jgi:hypothetical protein